MVVPSLNGAGWWEIVTIPGLPARLMMSVAPIISSSSPTNTNAVEPAAYKLETNDSQFLDI